jgi:hypothetical protein
MSQKSGLLDGVQTPGNKLQNLRYSFKSRKQIILLFLLQVFIPYLFEKLQEYIVRNNWAEPLQRDDRSPRFKKLIKRLKYLLALLLRLTGKLCQVLNLLNFLAFMAEVSVFRRQRLVNAKRNLVETLLQVNMERQNPKQTQRMLSYDYVNVLVVWTALGKSLSYLLPFLDFSKVRQLLQGGHSQLT